MLGVFIHSITLSCLQSISHTFTSHSHDKVYQRIGRILVDKFCFSIAFD